ncbi:MAG TPA: hypothetical protein V6C97_09590 [Oculatellaceae cyanobacterium]
MREKTDLLTDQQKAFLASCRCDSTDIERVVDGIFAVQWSLRNGAAGALIEIGYTELHRTSRFKNSTRARVDRCIKDLIDSEICVELSRDNRQIGCTLKNSFPEVFTSAIQQNQAVVFGFVDNALKCFDKLAYEHAFPELVIGLVRESGLEAVRVLKDADFIDERSGLFRGFKEGEIIRDKVLAKEMIANAFPICSLSGTIPVLFCKACQKSFQPERNAPNAKVLIALRNTRFCYGCLYIARKKGDIECLPHLVETILEGQHPDFAFAKPNEYVVCTNCETAFGVPYLMGDAERTLKHHLST